MFWQLASSFFGSIEQFFNLAVPGLTGITFAQVMFAFLIIKAGLVGIEIIFGTKEHH